MADIAKKSRILPDEPVLNGISRLAMHLWQEAWKHADGTAGGDAKALHDMRVAIRRLRSALQNFEGEKNAAVLSEPLRREFREKRRELGKVGDALGEVRDRDVLDGYLQQYAQQRLKLKWSELPPEYSGLLAFQQFLQNERAAAFAPMVKRLNKARRPRRDRELLGRYFMGLPAVELPFQSLREAAGLVLQRRISDVQSLTDALDPAAEEEAQHELRKAIRRLRYTFETLRPCFTGDVKANVKTLVEYQDLLGEMQDRTVLHQTALKAFDVSSGDDDGSEPQKFARQCEQLPHDVADFLKYGRNRRQRLLSQVRNMQKQCEENGFFEKLKEAAESEPAE